jgi:hypothetical protein
VLDAASERLGAAQASKETKEKVSAKEPAQP